MANEELKSQVISGVSWKFAERLLSQGITFILSLILARLLLPEDYGSVAMVNIFILIADVIITSGLSIALVQKKTATKEDYSTIFYCNLILAVVLYVILFFFAPLIADMYKMPELTLLLRVIALKLPISAYNSIQNAFISRNMQFKKLFYSTVTGTLISAVLGVFFAYNGFGAWALVIQQLSCIGLNTFIMFFTVRWHPSFLFSKSSLKSMIGFGSKVMGTDLIGTVYNQVNGFIVGLKYSASDLAYYTKGQNLPNVITSVSNTALSGVLFPAIAKVANEHGDVKKAVSRSIEMISFVIFPTMIGMALVAEELIVVLYTDRWIQVVPFMTIMCVDGALCVFDALDALTLKAIGKSSVTLKLELIKKPIYLVIIYFAVKQGIIYIAATVPFITVLSTVINSFVLKKEINYGLFAKFYDVRHAFILTLLMGAGVYAVNFIGINSLPISLIVKVVVGGAIYVIGAIISKNSSLGELLGFIKKLFRKKDKGNNNG